MADEFQEKIKITVDDSESTAATTRANKGLDEVEKKAKAAGKAVADSTEVQVKKILTISQTSQRTINSQIAAAEKRAALAGADAIQRAQFLTEQSLKRVRGDSGATEKIQAFGNQEIGKLTVQAKTAELAGLLSKAQTASRAAAKDTEGFARALRAVNDATAAAKQSAFDELLKKAQVASKGAAVEAGGFERALIKLNKAQKDELEALRTRAALAGKTGSARLIAEQELAAKALGNNTKAIKQQAAEYAKLIAIAEAAEAEQAAAGSGGGGLFSRNTALGRFFLSAKDFAEGRTSYAEVEAGTAVSKLSGGLAVGAGSALALAAVAAAAIKITLSAASAAKETQNLGIRLGVSSEQALHFQEVAKLAGVDIGGLNSFVRTLSRSLAEGGEEGKRGADGLQAIGISGRNAAGNLKDTGQLITEISHALKGLDTKSAEAKLSEFGGRGAVEFLPFFQNLDKYEGQLAKFGFTIKTGLIDKLADAHDQLQLFDVAWDLLRAKIAEKVVGIVEVAVKVHDIASVPGGGGLPEGGLAGAAALSYPEIHLAGSGVTGQNNITVANAAISAMDPWKILNAEVERGNTLIDQHAAKLDSIEAVQRRLVKDQRDYNDAEAQLQSKGQLGSIVGSVLAKSDAAAKAIRTDKELLSQLESQESARSAFGKKAADDLYAAEQKLADLRAGEANKEPAFNGEPTNVSRIIAKYADMAKKAAQEQNLPEVGILAKLSPARTTELIAAAAEDQKIRRNFFIEESEYEANLRSEESEKRFQQAVEVSDRLRQLRDSTARQSIQFDDTLAQESRDRQLRAIENTDAKTLSAKVSYILQAGQIEADYDQKAAAVKIRLIEQETDLAIAADKAQFDAKIITAQQYGLLLGELYRKQNQDELELGITTADQIAAHTQQAQIKASEAVRDADTKLFDSLKSGLSRLFDSLGHKGGIGSFFKTGALSLIKDVGSTQGARLLTSLGLGQPVGLTGTAPAATGFGKFLQAIGIGVKPTFPDRINQANHLGDTVLVSTQSGNAVPVFIAGVAGGPGGSGSGSGVAGFGNLSGLLTGGRGASPITAGLALALGLGGGSAAAGSELTGSDLTSSVSSQLVEVGSSGTGGFFGGYGSPSPLTASTDSVLSSPGGFVPTGVSGGGDLSSLPGFGASSGGPFSLSSQSGIGGGGGGGIAQLSGLGGALGGGLGALAGGIFGRSGTSAGIGGILGGILGTFGGRAAAGSLGKQGIGALVSRGLSGLKGFFDNTGGVTLAPGALATKTGAGSGVLGGALGVLSSPAVTSIGLGLLGSSFVNPLGRPLASGVQGGVGGALAGFGIGSKIPRVGGLAGAAIGIGGSQLAQGLYRGGLSGGIQATLGGAALGAGIGSVVPGVGTLLGAGIGAAVGGIGSLLRSAFQTSTQTVQSKVQSIFGIKITDQALLQQLVSLSNSQFNGSIETALTSPQGRQLIQLYAQSTGQKATGVLATPQAAVFANQNSQLTELPTYFNGQAVYPGQTQTTIGNPISSPTGIPLGYTPVQNGANTATPQAQSISLDAEATTALLTGQSVQTIQSNPRIVSSAATAGQSESATQRYSSAASLVPSTLLS